MTPLVLPRVRAYRLFQASRPLRAGSRDMGLACDANEGQGPPAHSPEGESLSCRTFDVPPSCRSHALAFLSPFGTTKARR